MGRATSITTGFALAAALSCSGSNFSGQSGNQAQDRSKNKSTNGTNTGNGSDNGTDANANGSGGPNGGPNTAGGPNGTGTDPGTGGPGSLGNNAAPSAEAVAQAQQASIVTDNGLYGCNPGQSGLVGKVYQLQPNTSQLPNLSTMTPIGQIDTLELNVPTRKFTDGFPAVPNLIEWFAIEFYGALDVPADGAYQFKTTSDDGSNLYVDDQQVVNNDGTHATKDAESAPVTLTKGPHKLRVDWYQGPRDYIALQVYWKAPGQDYTIIPATSLTHASDCKLQDLGHFP